MKIHLYYIKRCQIWKLLKKLENLILMNNDDDTVDRRRQRRLQTCDCFDPSSASDLQCHACSLDDVLFGI